MTIALYTSTSSTQVSFTEKQIIDYLNSLPFPIDQNVLFSPSLAQAPAMAQNNDVLISTMLLFSSLHNYGTFLKSCHLKKLVHDLRDR